ncbi:MAG: DUF4386 family protein [Bacteroidales bacterium]
MAKSRIISRNTEVITGLFALLSGIMLIFTILTRFEYITLFSSLNEDLEYLMDNITLLRINAVIWVITSLVVTVSASTFIAILNPFHKLFSWLTGFFLILSAAMICVSGIKALSVIDILQHFDQLELLNSEILTLSIYTLSREKEIYIMAAYTLLGFGFLSLGLFTFRTRRLSYFTAFVSTITGIIVPVFTSLIPESVLADIGLVAGSITFMVIGVRLLFSGVNQNIKIEK